MNRNDGNRELSTLEILAGVQLVKLVVPLIILAVVVVLIIFLAISVIWAAFAFFVDWWFVWCGTPIVVAAIAYYRESITHLLSTNKSDIKDSSESSYTSSGSKASPDTNAGSKNINKLEIILFPYLHVWNTPNSLDIQGFDSGEGIFGEQTGRRIMIVICAVMGLAGLFSAFIGGLWWGFLWSIFMHSGLALPAYVNRNETPRKSKPESDNKPLTPAEEIRNKAYASDRSSTARSTPTRRWPLIAAMVIPGIIAVVMIGFGISGKSAVWNGTGFTRGADAWVSPWNDDCGRPIWDDNYEKSSCS